MNIHKVLLPDGEWYKVEKDTFAIKSFPLGGVKVEGFVFTEKGEDRQLSGPLTSIWAMESSEDEKGKSKE